MESFRFVRTAALAAAVVLAAQMPLPAQAPWRRGGEAALDLGPAVPSGGAGAERVASTRGDADGDGALDLRDAVTIVGSLCLGSAPPACPAAADADGSGRIDGADAVYLLGFLFGGAAAPAPLPPGACAAPDGSPGYIVRVKDEASIDEVLEDHGIGPRHVYRHAIRGFAGPLPAGALSSLDRDPRVLSVEPDGVVVAGGGADAAANWGLDRIDQRALPLDGVYGYPRTGLGVTAYIIDSGIRYTHSEFGGRVSFGFDVFGGDGSDCKGHGTHVAGTVGGITYGVAKDIQLVSVKVLDCNGSGSTSAVIAGVDWVTEHHAPQSVANMSLGGGIQPSLDDAVRAMIASGVPTSIAAMNYGDDACTHSPARVAEAMTLGNSDTTDTRYTTSDYGSCVSWFAPGRSILSAYVTDDNSTILMTGTSTSAAFNTGVAALYLESHPGTPPANVKSALYSFTTKNVIAGSVSRNNHLLAAFEETMDEAPYVPQPPSVAVTYPLNGGTVPKNSTITIRADASDPDGAIFQVAFYLNDRLRATSTTAPYAFAYKTATKPGVAISVYAVAADDRGNTTTSATVRATTK